jgi:hypothetical protein
MKFPQSDNAIAVCKDHLDRTGARGTEIESYLVGYLLVSICSEYEIRLRRILEVRATKVADRHVCSFVTHALGKIVRSIKVSEIAGTLGGFGLDYKKGFHDIIDGTTAHTAYDNIMTNRHSVAHKTGTNITFSELEAAFKESNEIITAIAKAVGLTDVEIAAM